jgi:hypothetical protein
MARLERAAHMAVFERHDHLVPEPLAFADDVLTARRDASRTGDSVAAFADAVLMVQDVALNLEIGPPATLTVQRSRTGVMSAFLTIAARSPAASSISMLSLTRSMEIESCRGHCDLRS